MNLSAFYNPGYLVAELDNWLRLCDIVVMKLEQQ